MLFNQHESGTRNTSKQPQRHPDSGCAAPSGPWLRTAIPQVFAFLDMIYFQIFRTTRGVGRLAIYCSPGVSLASQAVLCAFEITVSAGASFLFLFLAWEFCVGYDGVVEPPWVPLHRHLIATCILFLIKGLVAILLMAFSMYSGMRSIRTNRRVQLSDPRNDILLVSSSESSYREGMPSYAGNAAQSTALRSHSQLGRLQIAETNPAHHVSIAQVALLLVVVVVRVPFF